MEKAVGVFRGLMAAPCDRLTQRVIPAEAHCGVGTLPCIQLGARLAGSNAASPLGYRRTAHSSHKGARLSRVAARSPSTSDEKQPSGALPVTALGSW